MSQGVSDDYVDALIDLGAFIFEFARIMRATHMDAEGTPESDTTHTVMLSVMACAVAAKFHPEYDLGKIAHYALVHDLVEVYAGDVITINYTDVDRHRKSQDEREALQKIKERFAGNFDWIYETIEAYEKLADPEARFVKSLDKSMPGIAQRLTSSKTINETFDDPEAFEASMHAISKDMADTYGHDQPHAITLRKKIIDTLIDQKYAHHGKKRQQ
jgi:5'-deoxynucleotidase YfbR-like HD superfamily hydrolase